MIDASSASQRRPSIMRWCLISDSSFDFCQAGAIAIVKASIKYIITG